jgi:hypothetical protein
VSAWLGLEPRPARVAPAGARDLELVLADAYDAAIEIGRALGPGLEGLEDVEWIETTIETLPMLVLRAATSVPARRREHLDVAEGVAMRLRVAIEVLDGLGVIEGATVRARACGIQARLRDARRSCT